MVLLILVVGLKPIIDIFWWSKFQFLGHAFNVQGLAALIAGLAGFVWAIQTLRQPRASRAHRSASWLLVLITVLTAHRVLYVPGDREILLKYWTSTAGAYLAFCVSQLADFRHRRLLVACVVVSFLVAWAGGILQLFGYVSPKHFDFHPKYGVYFNMTGFYYHPLDFVRVVIWSLLALYGFIISRRAPRWLGWGAVFVAQVAFFKVSNRMALLISTLPPLVLGWGRRELRRGGLVVLCVLAGWAFWANPWVQGPNTWNVLGRYHFLPAPERAGGPYNFRSFLRGRGGIWMDHVAWMRDTYTPTQVLFGKDIDIEDLARLGIAAEPHEQYLDWFENFGLVGLGLFLAFFGWLFWGGTAPFYWRCACLLIPWMYALTAEPLMMPTFAWMFALFVNYPTRDGAFDVAWLRSSRADSPA